VERWQAVQAASYSGGTTKAGFGAGSIAAYFDLTVQFFFRK